MKVTSTLDLTSNRITGVADPAGPTDAVNRQTLDNLLNGLSFKDEVRVATTASGALATSFANGQTVDGVILATGDRILIKNQAAPAENGIYVVNATGAPTRAGDADSSSDLLQATVRIAAGGQAGTQWTCGTAGPITVGTTALTFASSGGGVAYLAGNGLQLTSTTFSVLPDGTSLNVSGAGVRLGTGAAGNGLTVTGTGQLDIGAGNGVTVTADAIQVDTGIVVRKFAQDIGGSTSIVVTHNLGTKDVTVSVRETATDVAVLADWTASTINTITVSFATAPAAGQYRVVVHA